MATPCSSANASPPLTAEDPSASWQSQGRVKIIQELFQDYNELGYKQAVSELDAALSEKWPYIVIEPLRLGDETVRWIQVGNALHKTAVLSGVGCWLTASLFGDLPFVWSPFAGVSIASYGLYQLCWSSDPCAQYQPERDPVRLAQLNLSQHQQVSNSSVVVLRHREDSRRKLLHGTVAAVTGGIVCWKLYHHLFGASVVP